MEIAQSNTKNWRTEDLVTERTQHLQESNKRLGNRRSCGVQSANRVWRLQSAVACLLADTLATTEHATTEFSKPSAKNAVGPG